MLQQNTAFVGVRIIDAPAAADREYTYIVPEDLAAEIGEGCFVSVPFGVGNRNCLALVTSVLQSTELERKAMKPVFAICSEKIRLSAELLDVFRFICAQTLCSASDAIHAMIPSAALSRLCESYSVTDKEMPARTTLDAAALLIYDYLLSRPSAAFDTLRARFGKDTQKLLAALVRRGLIKRSLTLKESSEKTESFYLAAVPREELQAALDGKRKDTRKISAVGQRAALAAIIGAAEPLSEKELLSIEGVSRPNLAALVKKGLIKQEKLAVRRDLLLLGDKLAVRGESMALSEEQSEAFSALADLPCDKEGHAALLQGVTGSGKTRVMIALIDKVLSEGRSAIMLLPEIALTPQTTDIFCARYKDRVALLHSALSAGERYDAYLRIKEGDARLVIGTRSAIFAPAKDLGLIIIDEEQEHISRKRYSEVQSVERKGASFARVGNAVA